MFTLKSKYKPAGDQGQAIETLQQYLRWDSKYQTLWWVTGSGKTFTMANIIAYHKKPTLIIAHNKTLAAQLWQEFKEFFPDAAVHYFVSYYDYYQPEAYVSKTDTYIEKEATINEEIDRLRHAATQDLMTRKDVIIVASVSCIYGIGDIKAYMSGVFDIKVGESYKIEDILKHLVALQYKRAGDDFKPGNFQVMGDLLEIFPASSETVYSIEFWGDEVSDIKRRNYLTGEVYEVLSEVQIFPAKHTVTTKDTIDRIIPEIESELADRLEFFEKTGEAVKHERLKTKVEYDMEMMKEVWYVNGIENYSRYLDGRKSWDPAETLMDYFPKDFLCFVDESHMTLPQIGGMYAWDASRKQNLIENGFRLPSAADNRPLQFHEFEQKIGKVIAVSATPWKYEISQSIDPAKGKKREEGHGDVFFNYDPVYDGLWESREDMRIVPQLIRPTGLLDPEIVIKPMEYMIDDLTKNISAVLDSWERMLITTLTKRSSEELTNYLVENGVKVKYLHSEVDTLERLEILKELREWKIDVIVWVNLLREGLDLPEVSKIAILDADKQWFLRSESALIQIIGRAARNANGEVSMYVESLKPADDGEIENNKYLWKIQRADNGKWVNPEGLVISNAMKKSIDLTYYRRDLQIAHNEKNNITATTVYSSIKEIWIPKKRDYGVLDKKTLQQELRRLELEMDIAAANTDFEKAAELRDEIIELKRSKKK